MPIAGAVGIATPAVLSEANWRGLGQSWTVGRQTFDLTDISGGILLSRGVRGLGMPPVTAYTSDSPALAGTRYLGNSVGPREAFWPLFIWSDDASQEFLDRDRAFWASIVSTLRDDTAGLWTVTQPSGESRSLPLRYVDDGDQGLDIDPVRFGWCLYGITLKAYDQPFWQGQSVTRSFEAPADIDFFSTGASVFEISPGGTTDSAFIPNTGDVDAWPIWTVTGAVTDASLSAGGGTVGVPFSLASGKSLTVDTRPEEMTAIDSDGVDRSGDVVWAAAPVPPGANVELTLSMSSPGAGAAIGVELQPLFYRPW